MEKEILQMIEDWSKNLYFDSDSRNELRSLIEQNKEKETEIVDRFYKDLEFGTGGLRGIIGMGRNRINIYTVRKASWAVAQVLRRHFAKLSTISIVISYDPRHYSKEFAEETAAVMAGYGIKSYLFDQLTPTPLLSYALLHLKAQAGVMVTASHNPANYNGYKVYWDDGTQVTPPYDQEIIDCYNSLKDFSQIARLDFANAKKNFVTMIGREIRESYYQTVEKYFFHPQLRKEKGHELKFVYTPLHGTGLVAVKEFCQKLHFLNLLTVKVQEVADPNFSSVKSPNPEEKEAFQLAVELMLKEKAAMAFATDPDSDRLGVVINSFSAKGPVYLSGNQIAILLLHYILTQTQLKGGIPKNSLVIKSIVTSPMQNLICEKFGVKLVDTLTGFKWMCGHLSKLEREKSPFHFLFASEESFGQLIHPHARDKDAISALGLFCEMALYYQNQGTDVLQVLESLYKEFGFHSEDLLSFSYEGREGTQKIDRIMQSFRRDKNLVFHSPCIKIVDYLHPPLEHLPPSNVLALFFENGDILYLRPSGTEPKIKFYIMIKIQNEQTNFEQEFQTRSNLIKKIITSHCQNI